MATVAEPKIASEMGASARSVTISPFEIMAARQRFHPASRLRHSSLLSAATAEAKTLQRQAPDRPDAATRTVTDNSSLIFCEA